MKSLLLPVLPVLILSGGASATLTGDLRIGFERMAAMTSTVINESFLVSGMNPDVINEPLLLSQNDPDIIYGYDLM